MGVSEEPAPSNFRVEESLRNNRTELHSHIPEERNLNVELVSISVYSKMSLNKTPLG
jgi:hypothetical protein